MKVMIRMEFNEKFAGRKLLIEEKMDGRLCGTCVMPTATAKFNDDDIVTTDVEQVTARRGEFIGNATLVITMDTGAKVLVPVSVMVAH